METQVYQGRYVETAHVDRGFSRLERLMLMRFHPRCQVFSSIGVIWSVYFLYNYDWPKALMAAVVFIALGMTSVLGVKFDEFAETTLGRLALLHTHTGNLFIQLIGLVPSVYGIWTHSVEFTLIGLSIVIIGHVFGWDKVDRRLKMTSGE